MNQPGTEFAACTIIAKNYLPFARVLAESWHKFHPNAPLFVLLLDAPTGFFSPQEEDFRTILITELGIPNLEGFLFKYSILEASTAAKPYLLLHLFSAYAVEKLLYLDPDIQLLNSLDSLNAALDEANILLTPHLTTPLPNDGGHPTDHSIMQSGTYNLGFLGLRDSATTRNLLNWWCEKLYHHCIVAIEKNLFVDQRWMDLVPGLFDGVNICREPGYNVAYWNVHERCVIAKKGEFSVNGQPMYFFHFSGFDPDEPHKISKHQTRFARVSDIGETRHLYIQYRRSLLEKGWDETRDWKYEHDFFDNGVPIPAAARRYYWSLGPDVENLGDPFTWLDELSAPSATDRKRRRSISKLPFGVNVLGYLNSEKGTGEGVRSNLRIVEAAGVPFVANNTIDNRATNIEPLPFPISTDNPYAINLMTVNADQFALFAESHGSYLKGRYNVGYWAWEMPEFPPEWCASFKYADEIWTPSRFTHDSVASVSPLSVQVVPHSIDPQLNLGTTVDRKRFDIASDAFVFLYFFDFESFMERKNPLGLIHAYERAFGTRTDVMLLIKSSHGSLHKGALHMLQQAGTGANVRILDRVLSLDEKHELMKASDCYVSLHRSEGFGLTMAEAMLCGKPVIATNYSGNVDFMTPETSFLVPYKLIALDQTHGPYKKGYHWAEPDLDYAADAMRHVSEHRDSAAALGLKAREHVWNALHPTTIAKSVRERLQSLDVRNTDKVLRFA